MNEELAILHEVTSRLEEAGIAYMVTGSMALAIYGIPRMTRDIDIVIAVTTEDADKLSALFRDSYYFDDTTLRQEIHRRGMFNVIHQSTIIKVDFIVRKTDAYRIEEFSRRRQLTVGGCTVWVVAPEDLILSKLFWMRDSASEMQYRDILQLLRHFTRLDMTYLHERAEQIGVSTTLEKALRDA